MRVLAPGAVLRDAEPARARPRDRSGGAPRSSPTTRTSRSATTCQVLGEIANAVRRDGDRFWNSPCASSASRGCARWPGGPGGLDIIPRRFCSGTVVTSDGVRRRIDFSIREDLSFIGASWGTNGACTASTGTTPTRLIAYQRPDHNACRRPRPGRRADLRRRPQPWRNRARPAAGRRPALSTSTSSPLLVARLLRSERQRKRRDQCDAGRRSASWCMGSGRRASSGYPSFASRAGAPSPRCAGGGGGIFPDEGLAATSGASTAPAGLGPDRLFPRRPPARGLVRVPNRLEGPSTDTQGSGPRDRARLRRGQSWPAARDDGGGMRTPGVPGDPHLPHEGSARLPRLPGGRPLRMPVGEITVDAVADELPARLSCGQLRRCDEACAPRARARLSPAQGHPDPRRRHPCRASALRSPPTRRSAPASGSDGIGRLDGAFRRTRSRQLLAPYRDVLAAGAPRHGSKAYPGSPAIVREMLRRQDRGVFVELHPADYAMLAERFNAVANLKVMHLDGWTALHALIPPKERRGLVLIDPPYEEPNELERLGCGIAAASANGRPGFMRAGIRSRISRPRPAGGPGSTIAGTRPVLRLELLVDDPVRPLAAERQRASRPQSALTSGADSEVLLPALPGGFPPRLCGLPVRGARPTDPEALAAQRTCD